MSSAVTPAMAPPSDEVQHRAEGARRGDRHRRRVLRVGEPQQAVDPPRVLADVDGEPVGDEILGERQQLRRLRRVEQHLRRPGRPAVVVVGVGQPGAGQPLLDEPGATGVDARVEGDAVGRRPGVDDLLGGLPHLVEGDRRDVGIEAGLLEHVPSVVEDRRRDVERHPPLHAAGLVGEHRPGQERRDVEALGLDARRRRHHGVGVGHLLEHVLGQLDEVGPVLHARLEVLVDQLLVAVLVLQLDDDAVLAGVVLLGQGGQGVAGGGLHRVPERDPHRLVRRLEGVDRARGEVGRGRWGRRHAAEPAKPLGPSPAGGVTSWIVVGSPLVVAGAAAHGSTRQMVVGGPPGLGADSS